MKLSTTANELHRGWKEGADWKHDKVDLIYVEVNELKHDPNAQRATRKATFADAVEGVDEILILMEAWNGAGRP